MGLKLGCSQQSSTPVIYMNDENGKLVEPTTAEMLLVKAMEHIASKFSPSSDYSQSQFKLTTEQIMESISAHLGIDTETISIPEFIVLMKDYGFTDALVPGTMDFVWMFNSK